MSHQSPETTSPSLGGTLTRQARDFPDFPENPDLTPPPVNHLPHHRNHCLCGGGAPLSLSLCLSLSPLSRLSLPPEPHPHPFRRKARACRPTDESLQDVEAHSGHEPSFRLSASNSGHGGACDQQEGVIKSPRQPHAGREAAPTLNSLPYRGTSLIRKRLALGTYSRTLPRALCRSEGVGPLQGSRPSPNRQLCSGLRMIA